MKNPILFLLLTVLINLHLVSQPCLPEGITFYTQEEIDGFQINHPNCTEIGGTVYIEGENGPSEITNLAGLNVITKIEGSLVIRNNPYLVNLEGLEGLSDIEGNLRVEGNQQLVSPSGLHNLISVGGNVSFSDHEDITNDSLISLQGLNSLVSIGDQLLIQNNPKLESLSGLESLTHIEDCISIENNSLLVNIDALESLVYVQIIRITSNPSLVNLEGFSGVINDLWHLSLWNCPLIQNFNGLGNINDIYGNLSIYNNSNLVSLSGLDNVQSVDELKIEANSSLMNLDGLESVIILEDELHIENNPQLNDISGLWNIEGGTIDEISIINNSALSYCAIGSICEFLAESNGNIQLGGNLAGCNSIEEIEVDCENIYCLPEGITFTSQQQINSFASNYPGCTDVEGDVIINGSNIYNLSGIDVIKSVGGSLKIINNSNLGSLTGLENITYIGENLEIINNSQLTNLAGLDNLYKTDGGFKIIQNNSLSQLSGIGSLQTVSGIIINDNPSLLTLSHITNVYINDWLSIRNNDLLVDLTGCESVSHHLSELAISDNNYLQSLSGLTSTQMIYMIGRIANNPVLSDIEAFENLYWSEYFSIENCPAITSLNSLNSLSHVYGFAIDNLDGITDLSGLENLTSIDYGIIIKGCNSLVSLSGFHNLGNFNGGLLILENNSYLTDISAFEQTDFSGLGSLTIINNSSLSECAIHSICEYLDSQYIDATISNNAPGCYNIQEVEDACEEVAVSQNQIKKDVLYFPNPANNEIYIEINNNLELQKVFIYNLTGQMILQESAPFYSIDISALKPGIYFIEFQTKTQTYLDKLNVK